MTLSLQHGDDCEGEVDLQPAFIVIIDIVVTDVIVVDNAVATVADLIVLVVCGLDQNMDLNNAWT